MSACESDSSTNVSDRNDSDGYGDWGMYVTRSARNNVWHQDFMAGLLCILVRQQLVVDQLQAEGIGDEEDL